MVPNMLTESCVLAWDLLSLVSLVVMVLGFALSFYLGDFQAHNAKLKQIIK